MIIGVPKEILTHESRVSLTPQGVFELVENNHTIIVEASAGVGSGFSDQMYEEVGAEIVPSSTDVFNESEMIVKVKEPKPSELELLKPSQIVFTYFHFAGSEELTNDFISTGATGLAYETVELEDGSLPLLTPMSEVAGRMAVQEGAKYLETRQGGRGILLGGVPGVEPATVMILGGGIVGSNAAKIASGLGAKVYVLDKNVDRLRYLDDTMPKNVVTIYSNMHNILSLLPKTDLVVGAVLVVGDRAPMLITKDMLKNMMDGSVIVDVAVDQGGCVETCRPTSHEDPIFEIEGVIHYCVPNMPGAVPFTSTIALTNSTLPYIQQVANDGLERAVCESKPLLKAMNVHEGKITHKGVANAFKMEFIPPEEIFSLVY
tara:strand:- start:672 stop:1796 length:1125 start_codon:yes stop_codon:yes gene_type:complete